MTNIIHRPHVRRPAVSAEIKDLVSLARLRVSENAGKVAYRHLRGDRIEPDRLTYGELFDAACTVAAELRQSVPAGAPVLLLHRTGLDFVVGFFATLFTGNIAVPICPPQGSRRQDSFAAILRASGARAVLTTADLLASMPPDGIRSAGAPVWIAVDEVRARAGGPVEPEDVDPDAVAVLQFTSGSTRAPAGTAISHRNILENQRMIRRCFGHSEETVVVGWLPHYHDMGLFGNLLQPFYLGSTCVLMSPEAFVRRPMSWLEAISRYQGTTAGAPNFAYDLCVERSDEPPPDLDLSSWNLAYVGAEPIRYETLARFADHFGPFGFRREAFYPCYGLAEATLLVTGGVKGAGLVTTRARGRPEDRVVSDRVVIGCGTAASPAEVAIVDPETREPRPPGLVGEVWVRGPCVARGYWNDPPQTAQTFGVALAGEPGGGWMRTGDLGFLEEGQLFITGRLKNIIILAGENVPAEHLEELARETPVGAGLSAVAALGVDMGRGEEVVMVCEVQRRHESSFDVDAAAAEIAMRVATACGIPLRMVAFVRSREIPRTTSGKVRRGECREALLGGRLDEIGRWERAAVPGDTASHGSPGEGSEIDAWLVARVAAVAGVSPAEVDRDAPFPALGLDSKELLLIVHELSGRLGCELDPTLLWEYPSIAELVGAIPGAVRAAAEEEGRR